MRGPPLCPWSVGITHYTQVLEKNRSGVAIQVQRPPGPAWSCLAPGSVVLPTLPASFTFSVFSGWVGRWLSCAATGANLRTSGEDVRSAYVDAYFSLRFTAGGAGDCAPVAHGGWVCFVEGVQDVLKLQLRFRVASFTSFRPIGDVGQRSHLL